MTHSQKIILNFINIGNDIYSTNLINNRAWTEIKTIVLQVPWIRLLSNIWKNKIKLVTTCWLHIDLYRGGKGRVLPFYQMDFSIIVSDSFWIQYTVYSLFKKFKSYIYTTYKLDTVSILWYNWFCIVSILISWPIQTYSSERKTKTQIHLKREFWTSCPAIKVKLNLSLENYSLWASSMNQRRVSDLSTILEI